MNDKTTGANPAPKASSADDSVAGMPARLLRHFIERAALSIVLIVALASLGFHHVFVNELSKFGEETATQLGKLISTTELDALYPRGSTEQSIRIEPRNVSTFDRRIRPILDAFRIHDLRMFARDGRIVYSTESVEVGTYKANPLLTAAIKQGVAESHIEETHHTGTGHQHDHASSMVATYAPILIDGKIVGAIETYTDVSLIQNRVYSALFSTLAILSVLLGGGFLIIYLPMRHGMQALNRLSNELQVRATTDVLTGLPNRRTVLEALVHEHARITRSAPHLTNPGLTIAVLDIDHFKRINDTLGHQAGDDVLRQFAQRLQSRLRPYDIAGRTGGEEFLVVFPDTNLTDGLMAAERLRAAIGGSPFTASDKPLPVTVSIGIATLHGAMEGVDALIARADAALYEAKAAGRDRVSVAGETP